MTAVVLAALLLGQLAFLGGSAVVSGRHGTAAGESFGSAAALGERLYQNYMIPFQMVGILLLVAIVGAVAITRRHGRGLEGHMGGKEPS